MGTNIMLVTIPSCLLLIYLDCGHNWPKIGANIVRHGRYITFQLAEAAIPRSLFAIILPKIAVLGASPALMFD